MRWLPTEIGVACWCVLATVGWAGEIGAPPEPPEAQTSSASLPLHEEIDQLLESPASVAEGQLAGDAEFLRRVSLDLVGMPPTADEARTFLSDVRPDKRERAIDRSLNDPRFPRNLATLFSVMLLERRTSRFIADDQWLNYLVGAFQQNRPLNELIREILASDGTDKNNHAAVQFYVAREADPHLITRDVGRIIFGRDMECAQCHDHPLVDDYLQRDYHALLAVYSRGSLITKPVDGKEVAFYGENPPKDDLYQSVFIEGKHVTGPRIPGGATLSEPLLLPGADRQTHPEHPEVPQPVVSRRTMLAQAATDGANRAFNENLANRLWAHMMGRGLVHPVDLHHSSNPPTHPQLLELLGQRLVQMKFNVRSFLRELALTKAYQRSIDPPLPSEDVALRAEQLKQQIESEIESQQALYDAAAAEHDAAQEAFDAAEEQLLPAIEDFEAKRTALAGILQKHQEAENARSELAGKLAMQSEALKAIQQTQEKAAIAVEKLPGDAELAAAAKTFQQRAESLTGEVDGLQKGVAEKTAAVEQVTTERTAAASAADATVASLAPLKEETRSLEMTVVEARDRMVSDYTFFERQQKRGEQLDSLLKWNKSRQDLAVAQQNVQKQQELLAVKQQERADAQQAVEQLAATAAEASAELESLTASVTQAQQQVSSVAAQAEKLTDALAKINDVRGGLAADETLATAAGQIEASIATLRSEQTVKEAAVREAQSALDSARQRLAPKQQELERAQTELAARETSLNEAAAAVHATIAAMSELTSATNEKWRELVQSWSHDATIRPLEHLSPEELCWSMLQVTGIYDRTWRQEAAELEKQQPLNDQARASALKSLARRREVESRTYEKLKGNLGPFIQMYGAGAGQPQSEFFASAEQALFLNNGGTVQSWTAPAERNVTARMLEATEPQAMAGELYLGVLCRMPAEEEVAAVADYIMARPADKREAAVRELVWGLLTSAEFRFNH